MSLTDTDAKILNKTLANRTQYSIKKIIHQHLVEFITERQGQFNIRNFIAIIDHMNKSKEKNIMIIWTYDEKANDKTQYQLVIKKIILMLEKKERASTISATTQLCTEGMSTFTQTRELNQKNKSGWENKLNHMYFLDVVLVYLESHR